jgi:type 1 fimbria pilin
MKRAAMFLAVVSCATSAALQAGPTGTIHFQGSIVQETCADAVAVTRFPGPQQARNRCTLAAGVGVVDDTSSYTEQLATVSGHSGIDMLDYYADVVHSRSGALAQMLTRDYD